MYLLVQFSGIQEVEHLQEDESIEDEGEVSGVYHSRIVNSRIVVLSCNGVETATSNCTSDHSVQPLIRWVVGEDGGVVGIDILGDKLFTPEDQNYQDYELEDGLTDDVFEHDGGNDVLIS